MTDCGTSRTQENDPSDDADVECHAGLFGDASNVPVESIVATNKVGFILFANVRRQVSLAGGAGGSQKMGVKALGMLCCQHPLCLNAESR